MTNVILYSSPPRSKKRRVTRLTFVLLVGSLLVANVSTTADTGLIGPVSPDPEDHLTDDGRPKLRLNWLALEPGEIVQVGYPTHANVLEPYLFPGNPANDITHPEKECLFPFDIEVFTPVGIEEPRGIEFITVFNRAVGEVEQATDENPDEHLMGTPRPLSCFLMVNEKWGDPLEELDGLLEPIDIGGSCNQEFTTVKSTTWMSWGLSKQRAQVSDTAHMRAGCGSAEIPERFQSGGNNPRFNCYAFPFMTTNYCETGSEKRTSDDSGWAYHVTEGGFSSTLPKVCTPWFCIPNPIYNSGRAWAGGASHENGQIGCINSFKMDRGLEGDASGHDCIPVEDP